MSGDYAEIDFGSKKSNRAPGELDRRQSLNYMLSSSDDEAAARIRVPKPRKPDSDEDSDDDDSDGEEGAFVCSCNQNFVCFFCFVFFFPNHVTINTLYFFT
jgi:hypothetical protein